MFTRFEDFETAAFVILAIVFELLERGKPARLISKKAEWKRDVIAVVVLSAALMAFRAGSNSAFQRIPSMLPGLVAELAALPSALKIIFAFTLTDFCLYWIHRSMHSHDRFLGWNSHVWHHTSENLYWLSGARTSVVHAFLYTLPQVFIPFYLFRFTLLEAAIAFPIGVLVQFWAHSNLDIDLGPINWLFVNPVFHRVHHAVERRFHDSNYGTLLTVWDRMFGSYIDPAKLPAEHPLGVDMPRRPGGDLRMIVGV